MGGAYDTYSEMFKYKWTGSDGLLRSHEIPAPCHVSSPPIIAYACFGGLISGEGELQDVKGPPSPSSPMSYDMESFSWVMISNEKGHVLKEIMHNRVGKVKCVLCIFKAL